MTDLMIRQANLALSAVFRNRVQLAMFVAAAAVQGEAIGTMTTGGSLYAKRQAFASAMLKDAASHLDQFAWAVAANPTIGAAIGNPVSISSSTAANPCVVTTASAHGFVNGDTVEIVGHPGNTAANGGWIVTNLTSTTFSIPVLGNAAGTAGGMVTKQPTDSDIQFTVNSMIADFAGVTALDT